MIVSEAEEGVDVGKEMTIDDLLGTLKINPKVWGQMTADGAQTDRDLVASYAAALGVSDANSPEQVFKALGDSFEELRNETESEDKCSLVKSLSVIQILNTMSRVMKEMDNPSSSGFIMEAFLAALFPSGEWKSDTSGGIEDFSIGRGSEKQYISLKTMKTEGDIHGSKNGLLTSLKESASKKVVYYLLGKDSGSSDKLTSLTVRRLVIDLSNIEELTQITEEEIKLFNEFGKIPTNQDMMDAYATAENTVKRAVAKEKKGKTKSYDRGKKGKALEKLSNGVKKAKEEERRLRAKTSTQFAIKHNNDRIETITVLNVDPKILYETANLSLKSIVGQLVKIQRDYRNTVNEMHMYLSTLSNVSASGFKREVSEFDKSVRENVNGNESCEPDFLK
tara:strand:- start:21 stop:1199 length:1179 start_codon:yes stop_codon:yes gene_type:complete